MNDGGAFVFVYRKNEKFKCLEFFKSKHEHNTLIKTGWIHIATLGADLWLECLLNKTPKDMLSFVSEFKEMEG